MRIGFENRKESDNSAETDNKIIEYIKDYINSNAADYSSGQAEFLREDYGGAVRFAACLDYGSFVLKILYYSTIQVCNHFLDFEILYQDCAYSFSVYDIFNLLDIQDFHPYFYKIYAEKRNVDKALSEIFQTVECYKTEIETAGRESLGRLSLNYRADMENATGSGDWEYAEAEIAMLPPNHVFLSAVFADDRQKTAKALKRRKGSLKLIYEKRFLNYLESGNYASEHAAVDAVDFGAEHNKYKRRLDAAFILFSTAFVFLTVFCVKAFAYDAFYAARFIGEHLLPCIFACASVVILLVIWIEEKIIIHFISKKHGRKAALDYYRDRAGHNFNRIIAKALCSLIFIGWLYICLKAVLF